MNRPSAHFCPSAVIHSGCSVRAKSSASALMLSTYFTAVRVDHDRGRLVEVDVGEIALELGRVQTTCRVVDLQLIALHGVGRRRENQRQQEDEHPDEDGAGAGGGHAHWGSRHASTLTNRLIRTIGEPASPQPDSHSIHPRNASQQEATTHDTPDPHVATTPLDR
ncbi:MAG: hypothetical protein QM568_12540 [Microbacterium sp.]